jgi:uncharacterized membrane protein
MVELVEEVEDGQLLIIQSLVILVILVIVILVVVEHQQEIVEIQDPEEENGEKIHQEEKVQRLSEIQLTIV